MHVTQSTMSGILRRLRDQFDDELLVRNGRRYDLSPFAQSLAISVRQTILQIDSTISAKPLFDPENRIAASFRIMASDYSTMVYLARGIPADGKAGASSELRDRANQFAARSCAQRHGRPVHNG